MPPLLNEILNSSNLTHVLLIIGIVAGSCLGAFLFVVLILKGSRLHSFRSSKTAVQAPELIKGKFFIAADGYQLKWKGLIKPDSKKIILSLHDLGMTSKDFDTLDNYFLKNNQDVSIVSYDQRNYGENLQLNKRNLGDQINDLKAIVNYLTETYPKQELILLAEGKAFELARFVMKRNTNVKRLIVVGIRNHDPYEKNAIDKLSLRMGRYFKMDREIQLIAKSSDLATDENFQKQINENLAQKGIITIAEYFQWKHLAHHNNRHHFHPQQKVLILQPQNDFYTHPKKTTKALKLLAPNQLEINYFPEQKHFLLNEPDKIKVYELLNNWL